MLIRVGHRNAITGAKYPNSTVNRFIFGSAFVNPKRAADTKVNIGSKSGAIMMYWTVGSHFLPIDI